MSIPSYNPLTEYPGLRKFAYLLQWVVNLILGVIAIVLTAKGLSPEWFIITTGALNFVWTYLGLTAQARVEVTDAQ